MKRFLGAVLVIGALMVLVGWGVYMTLLWEGFHSFVAGVVSGVAVLCVGGVFSYGTFCAALRRIEKK